MTRENKIDLLNSLKRGKISSDQFKQMIKPDDIIVTIIQTTIPLARSENDVNLDTYSPENPVIAGYDTITVKPVFFKEHIS